MIKYENHCCDCAVPAYPCLGDSCPRVNVPVYYCDICSNDTLAEYSIEDEHYCETHAKEYLKEIFEDLIAPEQAELLKISVRRLGD